MKWSHYFTDKKPEGLRSRVTYTRSTRNRDGNAFGSRDSYLDSVLGYVETTTEHPNHQPKQNWDSPQEAVTRREMGFLGRENSVWGLFLPFSSQN